MKTVFIVLICLFTGAYISSGEWIRVDSFIYKPYFTEYPVQTGFISIKCADSMNCAAIANCDANVFCRATNNGGKTWKTTLIDTGDIYPDVKYLPAKAEGIVYPDKRLAIILCDSGYYYVSRDSCNTWEKKKLPTNDVLGKSNFLNGQIGIISTYKEFFITRDSAKTFERLEIYDRINQQGLNNLCIIDTNNIYFEADGPYPNFHRYLYKSTDFGKTFFQIYNTPNIINDMYFWNENKGVIAGKGSFSSHLVMLTSDGGRSWKTALDTSIAQPYGISQLIVYEENAFVLGVYSSLWFSTDTCKTWKQDLAFKWPALDLPASSIAFRTKDKLLVTSLGNGTIWEQDYSKITYVEREILIDESVFLFPNPATDYIEIAYSPSIKRGLGGVSDELPVRIYDVFGQEVNLTPALPMLGEGENNPLYPPFLRGNLKIDVSMLPPGVYFVRVGGRVGKFVKV